MSSKAEKEEALQKARAGVLAALRFGSVNEETLASRIFPRTPIGARLPKLQLLLEAMQREGRVKRIFNGTAWSWRLSREIL